jgi:hypothetical protein
MHFILILYKKSRPQIQRYIFLFKHFTDDVGMRDNYPYQGVPVCQEEVRTVKAKFDVGRGNQPPEYFMRNLGRLVLQGSNTYWHKIASRLPSHLQQHLGGDELGPRIEDSIVLGPLNVAVSGKTNHVAAIPPSATQHVQANSTYKVPSQQFIANNDHDEDDYDFPSIQGKAPFHDFMHIYSQCCVLAKSLGREGSTEMTWWLNNLGISLSRKIKAKMRLGEHEQTNGTGEVTLDDWNEFPSIQGKTPYHDFMHVYKKCCACAKSIDDDGNLEMTFWLNGLRSSLANKLQSNETNLSGLQSLPKTNNKRVPTRTTKVCSPKKNKQQRRK